MSKMMLRSSSTPILGSLLPSNSHPESPSQNHRPFRLSANPSSSPLCPKSRVSELRRVQSEGNIDKLMLNASKSRTDDYYLEKLNNKEKVESKQRSMQGGLNEDDITPTSKMHLAMGLGAILGGYNIGGGGGLLQECKPPATSEGRIEEHYKRTVEENPRDALYLTNYAHFLYKTKRDLNAAEEYYSRAILADPTDGDLLSTYANLIWELHHDQDRASNYFQRSLQAAPQHSHVIAAYAGFLWETEDEEADQNAYTQPALDNVVAAGA